MSNKLKDGDTMGRVIGVAKYTDYQTPTCECGRECRVNEYLQVDAPNNLYVGFCVCGNVLVAQVPKPIINNKKV